MLRPSDYNFELPTALIAQAPAAQRDGARLLDARGALRDGGFADVVEWLPADAVLVVNDTRVLAARVFGNKDSGGAVELLFLEPAGEVASPPGTSAWRCLAKARRTLRAGQIVRVGDYAVALLTDRAPDGTLVVAAPGDGFGFFDAVGRLPLPPYIVRDRNAPQTTFDQERYQTMFAAAPGAIAAPTAGLHMTPAIAQALQARGITVASVTLHVGWGTFSPIRVDDVRDHVMHRERYQIPVATADLVASGRPIIALGTTTMRALESAAVGARQVKAGAGTTDIFIYPGSGHQFRVVDQLITNFHLPESTLLMLVCAFAGIAPVAAAYRHAIASGYRFFSYGDAMLLDRVDAASASLDALTFTASMSS
ncbi:MAG: tRNA preQ1(34) S-adenosylmethionine ribosyltransferase-isomerase QueA [Kofleriaceae bacterium]|nr:tRNA preQ1(34) S-adenosylmethionine ribosyltransferase-isomerase QueA [Kofleriaceae bacterium]